jgi:IS30 family transposase
MANKKKHLSSQDRFCIEKMLHAGKSFGEKHLGKRWSPEQISSRLKRQSGLPYASAKSIRKFIGKHPSLERFLFWERNDMRSGRKRAKGAYLNDPLRRFIEQRPLAAFWEYGHWEGDFKLDCFV